MIKGVQERRDALRVELTSIKRDMQGINPKLSYYKQLEERKKEIIYLLEQNGGTERK